MKKCIVVTMLAIASMALHAQTSAEAIIGSCPTMPSVNDIAAYIVDGDNAAVRKYFQQLGEVSRKASNAATLEFNNVDFAKEQAAVSKKQKQIMSNQADHMEAGKRMMKFLTTLTPAQRKKFEGFRNEADAFQYLASIGKLDELHDLMEGVAGAAGDESPVDQADLELSRRDFTAELAAANEPIFNLRDSLSIMSQGIEEEASEANEASMRSHADKSGMGGAYDVEAVRNDMIAFWSGKVTPHIKILKDMMQAIRNSIPVAKMYDKQQNATRRINGQHPLTAMESNEYSKAMEYLAAATLIFPSDRYGSDIQEMMENKTQNINYNE